MEEATVTTDDADVVLVATGLKPRTALAPDEHRRGMLALALDGEPGTGLCTVELESDSLRYTVDTLDELARRRPGDRLYFILGWDSLRDLPAWHDPAGLLERHGVIAVDRPGVDPAVPDELPGECILVRGNPLAISSTQVRERAARGLTLRHLVPDPVAEYIGRHRLYTRS